MSYVRDPLASPYQLATPMGVKLMEERISDLARDRERVPTIEELREVGIDGNVVTLNLMAASLIHHHFPLSDPVREENRIWSRLQDLWAPRSN